MFFFLESDSQSHQKKNANILAENTNLHIIHRHLHTEFKRLYLQVCKINSVICRNCVPIQYPGHCTNEIHNTFKDHVPGDGRRQSDEGGGASVIWPGSRACLVWLQGETGKAAASDVLRGGSLIGWVSLPLEPALSELTVPIHSLCQGGKYAMSQRCCLLLSPYWSGRGSHYGSWAGWCTLLIPMQGRRWLWVWSQPCLHREILASKGFIVRP